MITNLTMLKNTSSSNPLSIFSEQEKQVYFLRSQGKSFSQIAMKLGISRQRVNAIEKKYLAKIEYWEKWENGTN